MVKHSCKLHNGKVFFMPFKHNNRVIMELSMPKKIEPPIDFLAAGALMFRLEFALSI